MKPQLNSYIEPTAELPLAQKHPKDRGHVAEAITRSVEREEPFSNRHRFIDIHGTEHSVMVVAYWTIDTDYGGLARTDVRSPLHPR